MSAEPPQDTPTADTLPAPENPPSCPNSRRTRRNTAGRNPDAGVEAPDDEIPSTASDVLEPRLEAETTVAEKIDDEPPTPSSPPPDPPHEDTTPSTTPKKHRTSKPPRLKDLEATITTLQKQRRDMLEDIDLYKLDIAGFKRDLARREVQLHELQHSSERSAATRLSEELRQHKAAANAVVAKRDREIARLENVVAGLKMSISMNTRVEEAVGDSVVRDSWGRIGYDVMNWCLSNGAMKGGRMEGEVVNEVVPEWERLVREGHRVHVVQAVLAAALAKEVFKGWFLGLEEDEDRVLRGVEERCGETATLTALTNWCSSTRALLRTNLLASPTLSTLTSSITATLLSLTAPFLPPPTPSREKSLTAIVDATIRIVSLMRVQRAEFRVVMKAGERWDPECMEDLTGEEEDGARVACVAWPGVEKWGDEMGEGRDVGNCVVKARVVCLPDEEGAEVS